MREYDIRTGPVEFLDIVELKLEEEAGRHGWLSISGHIRDEEEERCLGLLSTDVWEQVQLVGKAGESVTLFVGIVTDFTIACINDQKRLTLTVMTGSCLMDRQEHLRTWQDDACTYEQIFRGVTAGYPESGPVFTQPYAEAAGELVLQYHETDWTFLKRLASRRGQSLVPDPYRKGVRFSCGLPEGEAFRLPEGGKYRMKKDLNEYRDKTGSGLALSEADCLEYTVEERELHRIGDYTVLYGEKFYLYRLSGRYVGGEMLFDCHLKKEKGLQVPERYRREMAGCSLQARVLAVKEDRVQVSVVDDENAGAAINIWYPYATVYSTPDGTGWYCMPEPGDSVRLTIPQKEEKDAFVTSSVHEGTAGSDRKDPSRKVFKSIHQKEVRFTPDSIVITNNQGTQITLTDEEGIQIISDRSILLEAAQNLTITSDTGSLLMAGDSSVDLRQKGTGIRLEDSILFVGGDLKIQ